MLGSLVDNSLVQPLPRDGEPRFRLLETIREYALDRLRGGAGWREAHDRHAAYFLALAKPAESELQNPGQLAWLNRLEAWHRNLSAALSWLADTGQPGPAVDVTWATWRFWWMRGHADELAVYMEAVLATSEHLRPHQRAQALAGAAFCLLTGGDKAKARPLLEQSLPLYRQAGDELGAADAAAGLGLLLAAQGEVAPASELLEQTLAELRKAGNGRLDGPPRRQYLLDVVKVCNVLGQIRLSGGDIDSAAQLFTEGLNAARTEPDGFSILVSLYDLALSSRAQGDLTGATALLKEGLALAAEARDETSVAYYLEALAAVASQQDIPDRAVRLLAAARSLLQAGGSGWLAAWVPRAPHDDVLTALRSRVSDTAYEEAWAWAESIDVTRAVEYALKLEKKDPA
jgi:tetratricopeptide (TPR) repeat protein